MASLRLPLAFALLGVGASLRQGRLQQVPTEEEKKNLTDFLREGRLPKWTAEEKKGFDDFNKASKDFWKYVGNDINQEYVAPVKDAVQPTVQKVGRFLRHAKDLTQKAKALKRELQNSSSMGSGVLDALGENAKRKLNATTGKEALATFLKEARRRIKEANATANSTNATAMLNLIKKAKTQPKRSLIDILQINTNDPAWQLASKGVSASKNAVRWINETRQSGDVGQRVMDLLQAIPEERGQQIKDFVVPLVVSNVAIKDIPMSRTERAVINYGVIMGILDPAKKDKALSQLSYDEGMKAIEAYKSAGYTV